MKQKRRLVAKAAGPPPAGTAPVSAVFGRRCTSCPHVEVEPEPRLLLGAPRVRPAYRCGAPGPRWGYIVGEAGRPLPYIPAWCPQMITFREEDTP